MLGWAVVASLGALVVAEGRGAAALLIGSTDGAAATLVAGSIRLGLALAAAVATYWRPRVAIGCVAALLLGPEILFLALYGWGSPTFASALFVGAVTPFVLLGAVPEAHLDRLIAGTLLATGAMMAAVQAGVLSTELDFAGWPVFAGALGTAIWRMEAHGWVGPHCGDRDVAARFE